MLKAGCQEKLDSWEAAAWDKADPWVVALDKPVGLGRPQVWSQRMAGLELGRILQL